MSGYVFRRPALQCKLCPERFYITTQSAGTTEISELPDLFPATCDHCGKQATYSKKSDLVTDSP
jgi:hypothetical protein